MCTQEKTRENAVSPVIGVMLMLVVTIIIAAVVSAYAGGLGSTQKKAPSISLESHVKNTGLWDSSYFDFKVLSVSEPIPSKDIRIVTTWKSAATGEKGGSNISGWSPSFTRTKGGLSVKGNVVYGSHSSSTKMVSHIPYGFGPGVNASTTVSSYGPGGTFWPDQMFGNYTILGGTTLHNSPCSNYGKTASSPTSLPYEYTGTDVGYDPATDTDATQALFGDNWGKLRPGDVVNIRWVHLPSGKIIYNQDITVEG